MNMTSSTGGSLIIEEDYVSTEDEYVGDFNDPFELNLSRIRIRSRPSRRESRYACYALLVMSAFTVVFLFVLGFEKYPIQSYWQFSDLLANGKELSHASDVAKPGWSLFFHSYSSKSVVRMFDVDKDGLDDVIFGLTKTDSDDGLLVALRGLDGTILWTINTKSEIFNINCFSIDVDKDGNDDCIGSGRRSLMAFDATKGTILWDVSLPMNINDDCIVYNPLILNYDFDQDGVVEILVSVGWDQRTLSKNKIGRLMLIHGSTGSVIGSPIDFPNLTGPPVINDSDESFPYVLVGSGGDVPGNLYVTSLEDLFVQMTTQNVSLGYDRLTNVKQSEIGEKIHVLYETASIGDILPVVLVDMNGDLTSDILMTCTDGSVVLFDGKNFTVMWEKHFDRGLTPSLPAPGYYNDDPVTDFMIVENQEAGSSILILDGRNGSVLWRMATPTVEMASPLSIKTNVDHRDLFFFRAQGVEWHLKFNRTLKNSTHGKEQSSSVESLCEDDEKMSLWKSYGLVMDRTVQSAPFIVYKESPFRRNAIEDQCTVMKPMETNTGAIGFFDNNRSPDLITLITYEGVNDESDVSVFKTSLQSVISNGPRLPLSIMDEDDSFVDVTFSHGQTWTAYMGYFANSFGIFF